MSPQARIYTLRIRLNFTSRHLLLTAECQRTHLEIWIYLFLAWFQKAVSIFPVSITVHFLQRVFTKIEIGDEASRAARILGIDYADALTGFEFRGRHGTAILKGIVVAIEYREAVEAVIEGFLHERAQAEEEARILAALKMWKRFLVGLRIKQRVSTYEVEGEGEEVEAETLEGIQILSQDDDADGMESEEYIDDGAGGFFLE